MRAAHTRSSKWFVGEIGKEPRDTRPRGRKGHRESEMEWERVMQANSQPKQCTHKTACNKCISMKQQHHHRQPQQQPNDKQKQMANARVWRGWREINDWQPNNNLFLWKFLLFIGNIVVTRVTWFVVVVVVCFSSICRCLFENADNCSTLMFTCHISSV